MDKLDIPVIESSVISMYSVSRTLTDVNQTHQQIFAQSSHTFKYLPPTKPVLVEPDKRTTYKLDMCGVNPSSLSNCCLAQSMGLGQIWNKLGTLLDCPPSSCQSHIWVDLLQMHHELRWKAFLLQEGYCVPSPMQMLTALKWSLQSPPPCRLQLTTHCCHASVEHSIIMYCILLWYIIVIFVLHIYTSVGACSICNT